MHKNNRWLGCTPEVRCYFNYAFKKVWIVANYNVINIGSSIVAKVPY